MFFSDSPSKRTILYGLCFLFGVGLSSLWLEERSGFFCFWAAICFLIPPLVVFWRIRLARTVIFCFLAIVIGGIRLNLGLPLISQDTTRFILGNELGAYIATKTGEEVVFRGWVAQEPDVREDHVKLLIKTEGDYHGNVLINAERYPIYKYGTPLEIKCELERPGAIEDFRYDRYLRRFGVYAVCYMASVRQLDEPPRGSRIVSGLLEFKYGLQRIIDKNLPEPHASFLGGLLYGMRSTIPKELQEAFNQTGTTHIIAISGYNITIVTSIVMLTLMNFAIPRKKSFWFAVLCVAGFVVMVGANASVVRAALMGILALVAKQFGRLSRPGPLLCAAAVGMVMWNPFILVFDAGFQLSFVAVVGLIYLAPHVQPWFERLRVPQMFARIVSETVAAIVMTMPLMLYQFERFAVVAPVANALILLAIPWVMLTGFAAVVCAWIIAPFGQAIFWITWVLLSYVIGVVRLFAKIPFASVQASLPLWIMVGVYIVLIILLFGRKNKQLTINN